MIYTPTCATAPIVSVTRSRRTCIVILLLTIALGLASRRFLSLQPQFIATYAGDALWAAMVFWLVALVLPRAPTVRLAAAAFVFAVVIELTQLYHAPWIDGLRATTPGGLVLGRGFLWSDLVCYAAGVGLAALVDATVVGRCRALWQRLLPPKKVKNN